MAVKHGRKRKDERRGNDPDSRNEQKASEEEQQQIEAGFWSHSFPRIWSCGDGKRGKSAIFNPSIRLHRARQPRRNNLCRFNNNNNNDKKSSALNTLNAHVRSQRVHRQTICNPPSPAHPSGIIGTRMLCNNPPMAVFFFASRFIKNNCAESQDDDQLAFSTDVPKKKKKMAAINKSFFYLIRLLCNLKLKAGRNKTFTSQSCDLTFTAQETR